MIKKDVLFMCQFFYPEYITSALLPFQTAKKLAADGYKVGVLCGYPKEYMGNNKKSVPKEELIDNIHIKRVSYLQLSRGSKLSRLINYFSFVFSMLFKIPRIRQYKSIIIYSNPPILPIVALIANKLFGTKIVFVCYDIYPEIAINTDVIASGSMIDKIMTIINNVLYKKASRIIALSNEMRDYIIANRKVDERIVEVIPNWDTNSEKEPKYIIQRKQNNELVISYLGNMGIPQDFDTLLQVMADPAIKKENIKFIFAGHGSKKDMISDYVHRNKIENVEIYGYLQGNELEEIITRTNMFVLSLKEELNGLAVPSKFYTYLASNKPIIALINQDSDIARDIVKYSLGGAFPNGDVQSLRDYLLKSVKDESLVDYTETYKSKYTKDIQLNKYSRVIENLIGGN